MIQLETTDALQLTTSAACSVDAFVSYVNLTGTTVLPDKQATNITTATTTTILTAPGTGVHRVKMANIRNKHASSPVDVTVIFDISATDYELAKVSLNPGETLTYLEAVGWQLLAAPSTGGFGDVLERVLDADQTGTDVATAQAWFPTAGAVAVEAGVVYDVDGRLNTTRAAGAVSHTTSILFAGTASLTYINYVCLCNTTDVVTIAAPARVASRVATAVVIKAASTSTTEEISLKIDGYLKVNAAGTIIPQFQYSAAPGGVPTIKTGSHFLLTKRGAAYNTRGTWT